jgi:hypothetical protein
LKAQGSLYEYPKDVIPQYCSAAFMVPKGSDSFRTVIDNRPVNIACIAKKCKFDTLKLLSRLPVKDTWAIKCDMKDAYYQVPLRQQDRKYLAFECCGHYYHLNCLPFGWLNSPWFFTKVAKVFVNHIRHPKGKAKQHKAQPHCSFFPQHNSSMHPSSTGCICLPYLDDFLFVFKTQQHAAQGAQWVKNLLFWLGFTPHPTKSVWVPSQQLEHLGLVVDFANEAFIAPAAKLARLKNSAKQLRIDALKHARKVSRKALQSFCGFAQSMQLAIAPARLFLRSLFDAQAMRAKQPGMIILSRQALRDLSWWADIPVKHTRAAMILRPGTPHLFVDACKTGWGAVMNGEIARGSFTVQEGLEDIAVLEMRAVRLALISFADTLRNRCVLLREDNTVTEAAVRNHTSRSKAVLHEYRQLWSLADDLGVTFKVIRVASEDNLADAPSRDKDANIMLHPAHFQTLQRTFGRFDVDLFASEFDTQSTPMFFSMHRCPGSSGVDAFMQNWNNLNCYGFPPYDTHSLLQVVQKLRECASAQAVLIVPDWPGQPWFRELLELADRIEILSPSGHPVFSQIPGCPFRSQFPLWQALAVHVPRRTA